MSIKLTDTQLVLLGAAAQRKDHFLVAPPTLKGATAQKVARKLISAGFVKEVKAKASDPIWRRDEESGASYALKLTAAGTKGARRTLIAIRTVRYLADQSSRAIGNPKFGAGDSFPRSPAKARRPCGIDPADH